MPLPNLEQIQGKLPWHIAFSQKLGRHAIASRDIQAGEQVLAEEAVIAVPAPLHQESTCHTCLRELPSDASSQHAEQPIVDTDSDGYKRYCSHRCHDNDAYATSTAEVHAIIPQLAEKTACDPTLLHIILELDARCQQKDHARAHGTDGTEAVAGRPSQAMADLRISKCSEHAAASTTAETPSTTAETGGVQNADAASGDKQGAGAAAADKDQAGAAAQQEDPALVVHSGIQDVQALLGPWDRNEHSWRQAIAAGWLPPAVHLMTCTTTMHAASLYCCSQSLAMYRCLAVSCLNKPIATGKLELLGAFTAI